MAKDKETAAEDAELDNGNETGQVIDGTGSLVERDVQVDDKGNIVPSGQKADDDGGDEGDEEPPSGLSDSERELIQQHRREHRRESRQTTKQRRREAIARKDRYIGTLEAQVAELNQRVSGVERAATGGQMAQLEAAIQNAVAEVEISAAAKVEAMKAGDAAVFQEADDAHYNARRKLEELSQIKHRVTSSARPQATGNGRTQPIAFPARTVELARAWTQKHPWYNPNANSSDADSRIVRMLDAELVAEGWDHSTPEYWEELTDRAKERMPKRFGGNGEEPTQITSGSRGDSGNGRGVTTTLSAERVKAAKEAGLWEDPKTRARLIKRFQMHDKEASQQQR
jgi:hypothetical protein